MTSTFEIWCSLWRWRWWHDAGAEIALRVSRVPASGGEKCAEVLRGHMLRIEQVARWVPGSRCLDRALSLVEWADKQDLPAQLCVGVLRQGDRIRAHAWVQTGEVVIDPDPAAASRFVRLQSHQSGLEFDR
jgi:hypothetical protein